MAGLWRFRQRPCFCFIIIISTVLLSLLFSGASVLKHQEERHKRDLPDSTEIPAEHIDPAAIDLTPLVNTLINSSQSGSRQLFSLLSVTSYSSLALHKLTLLVYNISNIRSIENDMFRRRFCYCVTNDTNDLTDFTAILLDVMGNSTSYLQELFKSASIVSVSQRNNSDCIYICVMAGKMGRQVPELWDVGSITPLFNQTIVEGPHRVANVSSLRFPIEWHQLPTNLSHMSPSGMSSVLTSRVHATAHASPAPVDKTAAATETETVMAAQPLATAQQPVDATPPSRTATERPDTTGAPTSQRPTQAVTTTTVMTQAVTTSQTHTEKITTSPQAATSAQTTSAASPTTAAPSAPPATAVTPTALTTRLKTAAGTTTRRTTPTRHPTRPTAAPTAARTTAAPLVWRTTTLVRPLETEKPGCPWRMPELTGEPAIDGGTTTVSAHKLQPCVLELCKFFSQCLCRPFSQKTRMKRYCDDSHLWYEKHTSEVCRRVRRVSFSRTSDTPEPPAGRREDSTRRHISPPALIRPPSETEMPEKDVQ